MALAGTQRALRIPRRVLASPRETLLPASWRLRERLSYPRLGVSASYLPMHENQIGTIILDTAISLHRELGPGLLETVYEAILQHELQNRGLNCQRQVPVRINFRGQRFDEAFRADLVVEGKVILELKSVESISNVHKKQLLTYLKLTGLKLGYLLNFGAAYLKDGIVRTVNGL